MRASCRISHAALADHRIHMSAFVDRFLEACNLAFKKIVREAEQQRPDVTGTRAVNLKFLSCRRELSEEFQIQKPHWNHRSSSAPLIPTEVVAVGDVVPLGNVRPIDSESI